MALNEQGFNQAKYGDAAGVVARLAGPQAQLQAQVAAGQINQLQADQELGRLAQQDVLAQLQGQVDAGAISGEQAAAEAQRLSGIIASPKVVTPDEFIKLGGNPEEYTAKTGAAFNTAGMSAEGMQMLQQVAPQYAGIAREGTPTSGTKIGQPREINAVQIGDAPTVQAAEIAPVERVSAPQLGDAAQMKAAEIAPVSTYEGTKVGDMAQIDPNSSEFRSKQLALADAIQATAEGRGPSLAEMQLKEAQDRAVSQEMATIASQRGIGAAIAARMAANRAADTRQQVAQTAAQQRLAEVLAARQQLGEVAGTARTQDIGIDTANTAAQNTATLTEAGFAQEAAAAAAAAKNTQAAQQATLEQQAAATNVAAENQRTLEQGELGLKTDLANQLAANTQSFNQANLQQTASTQNAELAQKQAIAQGEFQHNANVSNQSQVNAQKTAQAQIAGGIQQSSIAGGATVAAAAKAADAAVNVAGINQETAITTTAMNNAAHVSDQQQAGGIAQDQTTQGAYNQAGQDDSTIVGGAFDAGGQAGATYASSDKKLKKDIKSGDRDVESFLDALDAYRYKYREPQKDGSGERLGVMAQDVEKSGAGKSMVVETPRGKALDFRKGLSLILAAQANLNERMRRLEK